jgi:hypothetical protein
MHVDGLVEASTSPSISHDPSQEHDPPAKGPIQPRRSERKLTSGGAQTKHIPTVSNTRKRRSKTRPRIHSQKLVPGAKQPLLTIMEEDKEGVINEKILIDLTLEDIKADIVSVFDCS